MRVGIIQNGLLITDLPVKNGDDIPPPDIRVPKDPVDTTQLYVNGTIKDKAGNPIIPVTITMTLANGTVLSGPTELSGAQYDAWTEMDPETIYIYFAAPGYNLGQYKFSALLNQPNVTLIKEGAGTAAAASIPGWAWILVIAAVVIYTRKTKKQVSGFTNSDVMMILLLVGGVIAFNLVMRILRKLGLGGDPTENEQTDPKSAFNPGYWQQFTTYSYAITEADARNIAANIHNAFGVFQDDYNVIYNAFTLMRTKANVSFLAWVFQKQYDENLLTFLTDGGGVLPWDGLSYEHLKTILDLVRKLPTN